MLVNIVDWAMNSYEDETPAGMDSGGSKNCNFSVFYLY